MSSFVSCIDFYFREVHPGLWAGYEQRYQILSAFFYCLIKFPKTSVYSGTGQSGHHQLYHRKFRKMLPFVTGKFRKFSLMSKHLDKDTEKYIKGRGTAIIIESMVYYWQVEGWS